MQKHLKEYRKIKIVFTGLYSSLNNGELAMLFSAKNLLSAVLPRENPPTFVVFPIYPDKCADRYESKVVGFRFRGHLEFVVKAMLLMIQCVLFRCAKKTLGKTRLVDEITSADVFVDLSGDSISDDYGMISTLMREYFFVLGIILDKPILVLGQTIGPFRSPFTRASARYFLNKSKLITLREKTSLAYLQSLGINSAPLVLTADLAFLLEPKYNQELDNACLGRTGEPPLIGLCLSQQIHSWSFPNIQDPQEKYATHVELMAHLVDHICDALSAYVVVFPHVYGPLLEHDDRRIVQDVYSLVVNKQKVHCVRGMYSPNELKWLIGRFDMIVSSRMHPVIAAASMFVPSVSLAYNHKYYGVIGDALNLKDYIIDVRNLTAVELFSALKRKIEAAWKNKEAIRESLQKIMPQVLEQTSLNGVLSGHLIDELVESTQASINES